MVSAEDPTHSVRAYTATRNAEKMRN